MEDLQGHVKRADGPHHEIVELLPWYLNETLEPAEHTRVEDHLRSCSACRSELEELEGLQKAVTAEVAELSEAPLERTLREIRTRREPPKRSGLRVDWGMLLRPRMALAVSVLAIAFVGVGLYVGWQMGNAERRVKLEEQGSPLNDTFRILPQEILLQGTFTTTVGGERMSQEFFTLWRLNKSHDLLLSSKIEADEFSRAGQAVQGLQLTSDYRPLVYTLEGPVVYQGERAEATFTDQQAIMSLTESDQKAPKRVVDLKGFPVLLDFSVMSHFAILHRLLVERLARGATLEKLRFTALTPQALRDDPLVVTRIQPATLKSQGQTLKVTRYQLEIGPKENLLKVELYGLDKGQDQILIGIYIPAQPRLPSPSAVLVYRSDLYPQGLELPQPERQK